MLPLGMTVGLTPRGGLTPVPAAAAGMTRVATLTFASDVTSTSKGNWTTFTDGAHVLRGGVAGGPTILTTAGDQTTRSRYVGCVEQPTAAQIAAGYTVPRATYTLPGSQTTPFCLTMWIRVGMGDIVYNSKNTVMVADAPGGNSLLNFSVDSQSRDGLCRIKGNTYGSGVSEQTSVDMPIGEWVRVWFAWQYNGQMAIKYQITGDSVRTLVSSASSPAYPSQYYLQLLGSNSSINQPGYRGQFGPFVLHRCDTFATASAGMTDYLDPLQAGNTVTLQAGNSDTLTTAGTFGHVITLVNRSVVMGSSRNVRDSSGARQDWNAPGATTSSRDTFALGVHGGGFSKNPIADTVSVVGTVKAEGEDWFGSLRNPMLGVYLVNGGSGELRCTETLANSWTLNGTYSGVYQYTGTTRTGGHPWGSGREEFAAIFGANLAAVGSLISTYDYSAWVDSSGNLYCQSSGGRPTERSCTRPPDLTGAIVDGLKITGFAQYDYQQTSSNRTNPTYSVQVQLGPYVTVLRNVEFRGHSKHLLEATGAIAKGLIVAAGCKYAGQPPRRDGGESSNYSTQDGDFGASVLYCTATGPGSIVFVECHPDWSEYYAVRGSATGSANVTYGNASPSTVFFSHGFEVTSTYGQADLVHFRFTSVPANIFGTGIPPAAVDTTNQLFAAFTVDAG